MHGVSLQEFGKRSMPGALCRQAQPPAACVAGPLQVRLQQRSKRRARALSGAGRPCTTRQSWLLLRVGAPRLLLSAPCQTRCRAAPHAGCGSCRARWLQLAATVRTTRGLIVWPPLALGWSSGCRWASPAASGSAPHRLLVLGRIRASTEGKAHSNSAPAAAVCARLSGNTRSHRSQRFQRSQPP